jgi:hypothetical protein
MESAFNRLSFTSIELMTPTKTNPQIRAKVGDHLENLESQTTVLQMGFL